MNFLTSSKSISITVIASLILLGFFYIAGATKKMPIADKHLPQNIKGFEGKYAAFIGPQSKEAVYLELSFDRGVTKLLSTTLSDGKTEVFVGRHEANYTVTQRLINVLLENKDGKSLENNRILKFSEAGNTLELTNSAEAKFGLGGLTFYKLTEVLGGTSWYWEKSEYANDTEVEPTDKTKFKLTFKTDGSFESSTDCNSLSGNYYVAGSELKFGSMVSTLMFCEGSIETEYIKGLKEIYTYMREGNKLVLTLPIDSGNMQFVKAEN